MLRSEQVATFVLIADAGSLNAATSRLGLSRSVVSERLAALERELGARLIIRSTRGLSLTPAGERFLEHARGLLRAMGEARDAVADADAHWPAGCDWRFRRRWPTTGWFRSSLIS